MARNVLAVAVASLAGVGLGAGMLSSSPALAEYDNPTMGETPCVVLTRYIADEPTGRRTIGGDVVHRAEVGVANICGRSVEVSVCIGYAEELDGEEESCLVGVLRPWSRSELHTVEAPVQLAGPLVEWRWLPRDDEAGM